MPTVNVWCVCGPWHMPSSSKHTHKTQPHDRAKHSMANRIKRYASFDTEHAQCSQVQVVNFGRNIAAIQFTFIRFNSNSLACSVVTVAYVVESRIHDLCFVFNQRLHGNCFACIVHLWSIIIHHVASHSWFSRLNKNQYPNIQQSSHCVWFDGEAATTIHNSDDIIGQ